MLQQIWFQHILWEMILITRPIRTFPSVGSVVVGLDFNDGSGATYYLDLFSQPSRCCNPSTATSDVLRDLDLDPLVLSRAPRQFDAFKRCSDAATIARRRQHVGEATDSTRTRSPLPVSKCPLATSDAHVEDLLRPSSAS